MVVASRSVDVTARVTALALRASNSTANRVTLNALCVRLRLGGSTSRSVVKAPRLPAGTV